MKQNTWAKPEELVGAKCTGIDKMRIIGYRLFVFEKDGRIFEMPIPFNNHIEERHE